MRITALHINSFGIFRGMSLPDVPPGLVLIQGDNEAGKSTLLWFIRGILFGYPDGRSRDPGYRLGDGETHGGRLEIVTDHDIPYTIARRGVRGGGEVTITDSAGGSGSLHDLLGGTTAQLYRNIYAFSLSELHTIDSLQADGVKGAIYGAASGTALMALPQARKIISDKLDDTFKSRGQKQQINIRLAELDAINESLRETSKDIDRYNEACTQLTKTEAELGELLSRMRDSRIESGRIDTLLKVWPEWVKLQDCEENLRNLPLVVESFPEDGLGRLETANQVLLQNRERLRELVEEHAILRRDIADLNVDPDVLAAGETISVLTESRAGYLAARADLPLKRQAHASVDAEIAELRRRLGPGWTEEEIRTSDCSVSAREAIRRHDQGLTVAGEELARAEQDAAAREETHKQTVADEQRARKKVEQFADSDAVDEQLVRRLQTKRELFREAATDLPQVQADLNTARARVLQNVREIDARWTVENVANFDVSVAAQQKIQDFADRLEITKQDRDKAESLRIAAVELLRAGREQRDAVQEELEQLPEGFDRDELTRRLAAISALEGALRERTENAREIRFSEARLGDKRQELTRLKLQSPASNKVPRWVPFPALLIAAAAPVAGWALGQLPEAGGVSALFAVVAVLCFAWRRRTEARSAGAQKAHTAAVEELSREIRNLESELVVLAEGEVVREEKIDKHARAAALSAKADAEEISTARESIEHDLDVLKSRDRLEADLRKRNEEVQRLTDKLAETDRVLQAHADEMAGVKDDWRNHQQHLGLAPESAVQTVQLIFTKVAAVRDQIAGLEELEKRIARMSTGRDSYLDLARQAPPLAPYCEGPPADLLSAVDRFLEEVQRQQDNMKERALAQRNLAEVGRRVMAASDALKQAREALDTAARRQTTAQTAWQEWLTQRGFDGDMSPPTALDTLKLIEDGVRMLRERDQLDDVIARLDAETAGYEQTAAAVFEKLNRSVPGSDDLAARVEELGRELARNRDDATRQDTMQRQAEHLAAQIESARRQAEESAQTIATLFKEADVVDEDTFRKYGRLYAERVGLGDAIEQAKSTIRGISGEMDLELLKTKLAETSREQLDVRQGEVLGEVEELEKRSHDLRDTKAELTNRIEAMRTADTVSRLRADRERVLAEIRPLALQWTRYALAEMLLDRAGKRFEKEQQPRVVRDAAEFFGRMTGGKYERVVAPVGADTFEVVTAADAERRTPDQLSRGTTEQLYLALRFGYIRLRAADHERLPIVMDDILVNFDPQRATRAAAAILELAREHQVLFFTCHPETVARFRREDPTLPLYRLRESSLTVETP